MGESALSSKKIDPVVNAGLGAMHGRQNDVEGCGRYGYYVLDSYESMLMA
jgi:hypothetical protein